MRGPEPDRMQTYIDSLIAREKARQEQLKQEAKDKHLNDVAIVNQHGRGK